MDAGVAAFGGAVLAFAGTIAGQMLTQRGATRARETEFREQEASRQAQAAAERDASNFELRRACYVEFTTATRQYISSMNHSIRMLRDQGYDTPEFSLDEAKRIYTDRFSELQLTAPSNLHHMSEQLNRSLARQYYEVKKLAADESPAAGVRAALKAKDRLWVEYEDLLLELRRDLGVE
ncbi:hypothetical protein [Cryptosporangium japonicum]|uniref:Secreted protein n=1 Tax=Cryptosporangium japonicum TaxID=80872 RepID=A0ABN0UBI5_9ACTN